MKHQTKLWSTAISSVVCLLGACKTPPAVPEIRDAGADGLISTEIRSALRTQGPFADDAILVETFHGTVLLNGLVDFEWQRHRAFDLAADVDGVNHVRNDVIHLNRTCPDISEQIAAPDL